MAAVILGHNLLRSAPGVDPDRIGITGISWGGVLACIAAGVDPRYSLMVPVYGCGFLGDYDSAMVEWIKDPEARRRWLAWWDPSDYLPAVRCPSFWINGTNDLAFPMPSVTQSARLTKGDRILSFQYKLPHGHMAGWTPPEIQAFVESHLGDKPGLARIVEQGRDGHALRVKWEAEVPVSGAELFWTTDAGHWRKRDWMRMPIGNAAGTSGSLVAAVPESATACFVNLVDQRGLTVSTEVGG